MSSVLTSAHNVAVALAAANNVPRAPEKFEKVTQIVIDNLEGGYYHPNMQAANPTKFAIMGKSGETMYGIDRVAGGSINTTTAGKAFWALIDSQNASTTWKYGYKAEGDIAKLLKRLAAKIIYDVYVNLCSRFGLDRSIVDNDDCLLVHWCYACWNGSGHFQKWAKQFNAEVERQKKEGKTDTDLLRACALNTRLTDGTKAIRDRADRISGIWKKYFNYTLPAQALAVAKKNSKSYAWLWILGGVLLVGGGIGLYLYKRRKAK